MEIPLPDDVGAVQPIPPGCELATVDGARRSRRRFLPSIISCILATASVAKPHSQQMYSPPMGMFRIKHSILKFVQTSLVLYSPNKLMLQCCCNFSHSSRQKNTKNIILVLCYYSKIYEYSNSYFTIRFDSKRMQLFEIFKYSSPQCCFWQRYWRQ